MSLIKDVYSPVFYDRFADVLTEAIAGFDKDRFLSAAHNERFLHMEWKERMTHTTGVLHAFLPSGYTEALSIVTDLPGRLQADTTDFGSFPYLFLPDYVATYGLDHFDHSTSALEQLTMFISAEFAVRPFIERYGDRMLTKMLGWTTHPDHRVRRLASEGCRPRLPWGMALKSLQKDPAPVLGILEALKKDPSEWVRRSVANNLNDISKDHPGLIIDLAKRWRGGSAETDALVKHGCRTLLKQGHPEILEEYGLQSTSVEVQDFIITTPLVRIGQALEFSCTIRHAGPEAAVVRLEYGVYYLRANGSHSRKVFKISERVYQPGEVMQIQRRQSFRLITTRRFYSGRQLLSVIVNGEEKASADFDLAE